jgi:hypothetical protein
MRRGRVKPPIASACTRAFQAGHASPQTHTHTHLYSARLMTREAKVWMLMRSMGEMSWPMEARAASSTSCALDSSPRTSVRAPSWFFWGGSVCL